MREESLDTNVLLRLALGDIPEQFDQVEALLSRTDVAFVVADAAIVELVFALQTHYGMSRAAVADTVMSLLNVDSIKGDMSLFERVSAHFVTHSKLSFTDCYLAEYARQSSATPLWTFDSKLANQHEYAQMVPDAP